MRAVFDERAMLQRWVDVEAVLATAQAELGIVPQAAAETIARRARVEGLDLGAIERGLAVTARPIDAWTGFYTVRGIKKRRLQG